MGMAVASSRGSRCTRGSEGTSAVEQRAREAVAPLTGRRTRDDPSGRQAASASAPTRLLKEERPLLLGAAVAAAAYAAFSIARHVNFGSGGVDLAIFDQAVWHYSRFEHPSSTALMGVWPHWGSGTPPSVLGDHFSPILVLLGPLYWLWSDPRTLLIAQGALVAASAVPLFLFSRAKADRAAAYLITASYLLFWGVLYAVEYDFHEVAFAPLFLACAVLFADRERWVPFFLAVGLLLATKEDLALLAVALGVYVLIRGRWIPGGATVCVGVAWYILATKVFIPHFADGAPFRHWTYGSLGPNVTEALRNSIEHPIGALKHFVQPATKLTTLAYLVAPWLGVCLLSPVVILALPLVAERMLSTKSLFWMAHYHYSLTIAPVLAMAAADGLARVRRWAGARSERLGARVVPVAAVGMLAVSLVAFTTTPEFGALAKGAFVASNGERVDLWSTRTDAARRAVAVIPPHDGSVAAQFLFLPHLSQRDELYLIETSLFARRPRLTDYVIYRARGDIGDFWRRAAFHRFLASHRRDYTVAFSGGGYTVLRKRRDGRTVARRGDRPERAPAQPHERTR
jgi:uncharacterized membrane protein